MQSTKRQQRGFETLEAKQMLAGDVFVEVVEGSLFIRGDEDNNQIAISSADTPGSYVIRGLDGTNVRMVGDLPGEASEGPSQVTVEGVRRHTRIRMGAGDDTVIVGNADFRGVLSIGTGAGEDNVFVGERPRPADPAEPSGTDSDAASRAVSLEMSSEVGEEADGASVRIGRSLRIATGADGDNIVVNQTDIRGSLLINSGAGNDRVRVGQAAETAPPTEVLDETPRDSSSVRVGRHAAIRLAAGDDQLLVRDVAASNMHVSGGQGEDTLRLVDTNVRQNLHVAGGRGDASDSVSLNDVSARRALLHTGAGDDNVRIVDSAFGVLAVALGEGDDSLTLGGTSARAALLGGGPGEDVLTLLGENRIGRRIVRGFETRGDDATS